MAHYVEEVQVPNDVWEEVRHISDTVPVFVYWDGDGNALLLSHDNSYIVSVSASEAGDPTVETAYLVNEPPIELIQGGSSRCAGTEQEMADDFTGFTPGFTT